MNNANSAFVRVFTGVCTLFASLSATPSVVPIESSYSVLQPASVNETQKVMVLNSSSAYLQAASVFPMLRNFTAEEALAYERGLSRLFKKTGRKVF